MQVLGSRANSLCFSQLLVGAHSLSTHSAVEVGALPAKGRIRW